MLSTTTKKKPEEDQWYQYEDIIQIATKIPKSVKNVNPNNSTSQTFTEILSKISIKVPFPKINPFINSENTIKS